MTQEKTQAPEVAAKSSTTQDAGRVAEQFAGFFNYGHLPEHLKPMSKIFGDAMNALMAEYIAKGGVRGAELTVAVRKLLEAKDAAVRAILPKQAP